ncbi:MULTISPECIES: DUF4362 domain-containing protein [unclassified Paenibacillus]|uniref:DUF4362 domain-containing protein n=1 Tax=unclassified Paenibacillus TaxID=185978 RepID=UPI00070FA8B3|nr:MULTISPECIES: DUF4362 domain-containing protein [unclassified Paenibacillus]KQX56687.1 hypothetical protein ASD40_04625 [Paenibacillus sp. Root444D2]KRE50223.1 hypothetical protein ASG85_22550 [Paenibacillus sp. Soil724D2]
MRRIICLILSVFVLSGCHTYTLQDAKKNGDIIVGHLGPTNFEKIDSFITDFENQKASKLRITSYSEEGDPILSDLIYDGKQINYIFDDSRDKHGGIQKGKDKTSCNKIEKRSVTREGSIKGFEYILTGCKEIIGFHSGDKNEIFLMFKAQ